MNGLLAARSQLEMSLCFHIVFAAIGIAMPLLMIIAEWQWLRTKDEVYLALTKRWAKGTAILFAVGAVSGTVLSFELGLLWPGFMRYAGAIIGMPFSLEGFAFFTEAIFLGIYLYGRTRLPPRAHLFPAAVAPLSRWRRIWRRRSQRSRDSLHPRSVRRPAAAAFQLKAQEYPGMRSRFRTGGAYRLTTIQMRPVAA